MYEPQKRTVSFDEHFEFRYQKLMFSCLVALAHLLNHCVIFLGLPNKVLCPYFEGVLKQRYFLYCAYRFFIQAVWK